MPMEVEFVHKKCVKVDQGVIEDIKKRAAQNPSGKFRYCFHDNEEAGMQEMLFVIPKSGYSRPHKHEKYAESHVVIEGEGYMLLFDDAGQIIEGFQVSKEKNFLYRVAPNQWHMLVPESEIMVIYEIREGKFDKNTNIFPSWAPCEKEKVLFYKAKIDEFIKNKFILSLQKG